MDLTNCQLCPRACSVNRESGELGFCGAGAKVKVALASLHQWEEPCLVGENGAGTVFFSHCNLHCVFCQNYEISQQSVGKVISVERLAEIFLEQQKRGASTLDLVTPTHYVPQIIDAVVIAKAQGFNLPIVYNSNAYENVATIKALADIVDIFLPDFKYFSPRTGKCYAQAIDYPQVAQAAIQQMFKQVGKPVFQGERLIRGVIVRHLVLPSHSQESLAIVQWLWQTFANDVYLSLMNQFTPLYKVANYPKLNRNLTSLEYNKVVKYAEKLGFINCFIQTKNAAGQEFIPKFDGAGVE